MAAICNFFSRSIPQIEADHLEALAPIGGMRKGGSAERFETPLAGGAAAAAWGEPARPGFPPGETGKGEIRLPCCRRQFAPGADGTHAAG